MLKSKDRTRSARPGYILATMLLIGLTAVTLVLSGCGAKNSITNSTDAGRSTSQIAKDSASAPQSELGSGTPENIVIDRKTIQNADLSMKVQDVTAAIDQIIALANQNGGYTVNSHISRNDQQVSGRLSVKVPQDNLLPVIAAIADLGEITDKTITTQDVTQEYYDAQARLKALQTKEERLLGLMDKAANVTELISIESELGKTRSDIEVLTGRLQYLTNVTTYSLINITLVQGLPGTIQAPQGTLGRAWQGFVSSISGLINFADNVVVFLFTALPWLAVLTLLFLLGWYFLKRFRVRKQ